MFHVLVVKEGTPKKFIMKTVLKKINFECSLQQAQLDKYVLLISVYTYDDVRIVIKGTPNLSAVVTAAMLVF